MQNLKTPFLFELPQDLPKGFFYQEEIITINYEQELLKHFEKLPFESFLFHGYSAKRRVIHWGWSYDFENGQIKKIDPIPDFLLPARAIAAQFAEIDPSELSQTLVTQYPVGSVINWHRDAPAFETIVGISLLSPCEFRFRPYKREKGDKCIVKFMLAPRSAYIMTGRARTDYQHSIAPVKEMRYSITFRTLRTNSTGAYTIKRSIK